MSNTIIGIIRLVRGRSPHLIVEGDGGERVDVSPRQGLMVFPGDRVKVELVRPKWARFRRGRTMPASANIVALLSRSGRSILGKYRMSRKRAWVAPGDGVTEPFEVNVRADIPEGALVAVDPGESPGAVTGTIASFWKDPDAPRAVIEQLIYERGLPREFSPAAQREADDLPDGISAEEMSRRVDLRDHEVVVIDPADAKDHDDGVSWKPSLDGGGRLGVHIADVAHYVRPGSALDAEACARGVSCYLTDRVIPMLPFKISADLCSLMEGQDRLARTVFMDLDANGHVRGGEMVESVIRPAAFLSYEEVSKILGGEGKRSRYADVLKAMDAVARKIRANRFADGSLDFNFPETKVILGSDGEPASVTQTESDPSHWLIEEFMIAANRFVGERLTRQGLGIWRIHEPPKIEDVNELEEFLKGLGVKFVRRGARSRDLHPGDFQALLKKFAGTPEEYAVHRKVLRSLRLAVYSARNVGHFGLAVNDYTHFTSPIRRYADLIVHRLTGGRAASEDVSVSSRHDAPSRMRGRGRSGTGDGKLTPRRLGELAASISSLERVAQEAEWACTKKMLLRYLERRMGDIFPGTISRAEKYGVFVELDGIGMSGLVRREDIGNDWFWLSGDGMSLRGRRTGMTIRVGDRVRVLISRIDREADHLDLVFADD